MNKWGVRIIGIMLLLMLIFFMTSLYKQLVMIKEQNELEKRPAATSTKP